MIGTFRDPAGSLFDADGRILRVIRPTESVAFREVLESEVVQSLIAAGALVGTRAVARNDVPGRLQPLEGEWFEHDRVGFVSVPAEWSAAMLADAARHTLDVGLELLKGGFVLKDATPANILFDGTRPVLVDVPSIERLVAGRGLWTARHQFETAFLLPLLAILDLGYPMQCSLADPARGLSHEQLAKLYGPRRWWKGNRIRHVALAAALGSAGGDAGRRSIAPGSAAAAGPANLERTRFVLAHSMSGLRKAVNKVASRIERRHSHWSRYAEARAHYADDDLARKRAFVGRVLQLAGARWVLDVGANTGEFSDMASVHANVVGIDLDEISVSAIHSRARVAHKPIQALVVDLSQPTPATGWRNAERKSFLERVSGRFDLAMMLAVGHHLRVTAGVPLEQIVETGMQIGGGSLLFEFVPTADPMFQAIARGRESIYSDNTLENCESLLAARGRIEIKESLPNGRTLFWVRSARTD